MSARLPKNPSRSVKQKTAIAGRSLISDIAPCCSRAEVVGNLRLGVKDGTVKLLVCPGDGGTQDLRSGRLPSLSKANGQARGSVPEVLYGKWRPLKGGSAIPYEIVVADPERWGVLELYHTGPKEFIAIIEGKAKREGLNFIWDRGVCKSDKRGLVSGILYSEEMSFPTEESLFRAIGMDFVLPEQRISFCRPFKRTGRRRRVERWRGLNGAASWPERMKKWPG